MTSAVVSLTHLILNPPRSSSHCEKIAWMSLVLSSGGNPLSSRIRVTRGDKRGRAADMLSAEGELAVL